MTQLGSFRKLSRPLLKNDFVYHVVMTKSMEFFLTQRTIKATRIQLNEIRARAGMGATILELPNGLKMEFDLSQDLDAFMYDYLTRFGHYETEVESILPELVTRETTFVDVGANVGYFTTFCAKIAREVYAFEPVPETFERLSRNIGLNHLSNVKAFQTAVASKKSNLRLYQSRVSSGHDSTIRRFEHGASILVDAVTLDEWVDRSDGDVVLKVDAEGSEMDVLLGASRLIGSGRVSFIILEWEREIYSRVTDLSDRFALYSRLGVVEVLDEHRGSYVVRDRQEVPEVCNLLIRVRRPK